MSFTRNMALATTSAIALTILSAFPTFAVAQTPPVAAPESGLETVIVTARKREESSQDVPVSVSTLRGDTLSIVTSGGADMLALSARTPSLVIESSYGKTFPRPYIRGLGNTDFDLNASQPVSFVYDEVVQENPILKGFPAFDLQRIEVLRGPQGTLFGRNTPAGIVKFDSVKPSASQKSYATVGLRNYGGYDLETGLGFALGDTFNGRLSLQHQSTDSWIKDINPVGGTNNLGGSTSTAYRLQAAIRPNENFDVLVNLHGREMNGDPVAFRAGAMTRGTRGLSPNIKRDQINQDAGASYFDLTTNGASIKATYDLGGSVLTYIGGVETVEFFSRGDVDGGSGAFYGPPGATGPGYIKLSAESADGIDDLTQITHELRLSSDATGPFAWQIGAYLFDENVSILSLNYDTFAASSINGRAIQSQKTESYAFFASGSYEISEQLTVSGGLRYTDDDKKLVASSSLRPFGPPIGAITTTKSDEALSWDVSAVYQLNDDVNVFGRVARGYRAPSIQGRLIFDGAVTTADSEFVTSYEVGMKALALDNRLRADFTLYSMNIEDQQLTAIGGIGNVTRLLNAKESAAYGVETELEFKATANLTLGATLSYNKTEFKDPTLRSAGCASSEFGPSPLICNVLETPAIGGFNINGKSFPNAPEVIANLSAKYVYPLSNGGNLFALTDWSYKGETKFFLYNSIEFAEDGFWEGGLRVGYETPGEKFEVAAYGRNITDTEALVGAIDFTALTGILNSPRVFGIEVKAKF